MATVRSFSTRNDLPADTRSAMIALLNQQLADSLDLASQIKQAHWNVKGPNFIALHELFDKLADAVNAFVDEMAERVTALGGYAQGTVRMATAASRLTEWPDVVDGVKVTAALADRYAALAQSVRTAIDTASQKGDADTADLFTGFSRELDKGLWFLEAHLQT